MTTFAQFRKKFDDRYLSKSPAFQLVSFMILWVGTGMIVARVCEQAAGEKLGTLIYYVLLFSFVGWILSRRDIKPFPQI